jgi:hypothetical protein
MASNSYAIYPCQQVAMQPDLLLSLSTQSRAEEAGIVTLSEP